MLIPIEFFYSDFFLLLVAFTSFIVGGIYFVLKKFRSFNHVFVLREYGDSWEVVYSRKLPRKLHDFVFNNGSYKVDLGFAIRNGRKNHLYYEENKYHPIKWEGNKADIDGRYISATMKTSIFNNIFHHTREKMFLYIVIALIIVAGIIAVVSIWQISELAKAGVLPQF